MTGLQKGAIGTLLTGGLLGSVMVAVVFGGEAALSTEEFCTSCHSIDGAKSVGPTWKGTFGTEADVGGKQVPVDAAFIEKAIVDPNAEVRSGYGPSMPSFEGKLSDEEIAAIVEYMKSLSG